MRTLLLVGASVFALGIGQAAAQQSTTVDGTGDNFTNDIEQTSAAVRSAAITVTQDGDGANPPNP